MKLPVLRLFLLACSASLQPCAQAPAQPAPTQIPSLAAASPPVASLGLPTQRLIVLNKAEGTASLIDPQTRREVALVTVGEGPHEVAVAPDGRTAVVCNYGAQTPGSTLTVIDIATAKATRTFALERPAPASSAAEPAGTVAPSAKLFLRPHGIVFAPSGAHVIVTSELARRLLRVNVTSGTVEHAWTTPQQTMHMVALAADGKRAFATSIMEGSLAVFDLAAPGGTAAAKILDTGAGAEGLAVHPTDGTVWVGNRSGNSLTILDGQSLEVLATLETGRFPIRVAITPDGAHALVSCAEAGTVQVFATKTRSLAHTVELSENDGATPLPIGICIQPDGRFAWVACARGEFLAVIDLATWSVAERVPARRGPDGMAWAQFAAKPG